MDISRPKPSSEASRTFFGSDRLSTASLALGWMHGSSSGSRLVVSADTRSFLQGTALNLSPLWAYWDWWIALLVAMPSCCWKLFSWLHRDKGLDNQAISNVFGSNSFNILMGSCHGLSTRRSLGATVIYRMMGSPRPCASVLAASLSTLFCIDLCPVSSVWNW